MWQGSQTFSYYQVFDSIRKLLGFPEKKKTSFSSHLHIDETVVDIF